jgi:prepilin-type N-terminal cleavage/methylation domain-containing protein
MSKFRSEQAFTLVELVVVLAVVAVLGGLFILPAIAATHDRSNRAVCQNHLRQIAIAMTVYAADNMDVVVPASKDGNGGGQNFMTISMSPSEQVAKQIGLSTNQDINNIWTCPDRPQSLPFIMGSQRIIGYQYFGGVTKWNNSPSGETHSPVKISQAKPYWTLAGDAFIKTGAMGKWVGKVVETQTNAWYYPEFGKIPPHHTGDTDNPQGGNQVFCDGSVQWIKLVRMHRFMSFSTGVSISDLNQVSSYFYQDPSDFSQSLLDSLVILY